MLDQSILSDIRDRLPISAFIGERVPLKKAGRNFRGLCPFHQEKTPSFMVSDEKQIFHCFGCGEGGDVFKFLMKFEGLTFAEAVRQLADRTGVTLPRDALQKGAFPDAQLAQKKKWSHRLNQLVAQYFHEALLGKEGECARNYLISRGISDQIWTQHFLGYAEKRWDSLISLFEEKKVPWDLALELGLIKKRNQVDEAAKPAERYYDFFRHRLIFPIISSRGEVIGFSGRTLDTENENQVKYLNSPDSLIYHKSNSVYGLHAALEAIRKEEQIVLVEGNIDLLTLYQNGIKNVVAPLGTAFTSGHLRLLSRFSKNIVVVFDSDEAGKKAALRALPIFIEMNIVPRAVNLPAGEDPDSFVKKYGTTEFKSRLSGAPTLFEHVVNQVAQEVTNDTAGRIEAMRRIVPLLSQVGDPVERSMYQQYISKRLRVKEEMVSQALGGAARKAGREAAKKRQAAAPVNGESVTEKGSGSITAERLLIETMIRIPDMIPAVFGRMKPKQFADRWCRTIAELLADEWQKEGKVNLGQLLEGIADPDLALELRTLALTEHPLEAAEARQLVDDCMLVLERRPLTESIEQVNEQIRDAEAEGDEARLLELLTKKRDLAAAAAR